MSAVSYNKQQDYDVETVKRIQRTVGASADGKWGKQTVKQIQAWQRAQGIAADGKVGPGTFDHFKKVWVRDDEPSGEEELDDVAEGEDPHDDDDDDDEASDAPPRVLSVGQAFAYFDADADLREGDSGDAVLALQNDLFAFGVCDDSPSGKFDKATTKAVVAFQTAARAEDRISAYARKRVRVSFGQAQAGIVDAPTRAEIRVWKQAGFRCQSGDFVERRVRVARLGSVPRSSAVLVEVPGTGGKTRLLHRLAAVDLAQLVAACKQDIGVELLVQSGWRRHRWSSRKQYEQYVTKKYGSVKEGRKWLAYSSPHETGLAVDFGTGGLEPKSKTAAKQKKTPAYAWLIANAYRFGFTPYKREPWHWEHPLSLRAWTTGLSDWRLSDEDE
ncbi:peptidoglycan-binding protein [Pseudenhygromyxa sp. WMMC2535]|uniref:M15 family metallopeptidase n=1 Tax=Pseudenhygromyxa sp. WMMC2535 TaxID=2712867 RepID=UPI0015535EB1|nr:M15 family metallopeptidase [Pseudenhygromyxa sp. WMMC2535]NVB40064.1 peptidoglycan-binding protein [Pseudenhygromyxa sp. WMMC2535]